MTGADVVVSLLLELGRAVKDAGYEGRIEIQSDPAESMIWTSEHYTERTR